MADVTPAEKDTALRALFKVMASLLEDGQDRIAEGDVVVARRLAQDAAVIGDAIRVVGDHQPD